ncbi:hypothetical protein [Streptosporangium sp. NPDC051022]|uniref:hypothetical protein n=1 Tax=Streptosporangium sp. NPDC051022 TaxID=3155752 RepID=UPI00344AE383
MAESPFKGFTLEAAGPAKAVSFTKDKLDQLGNDFGGRAGDVETLARQTGAIGIDPPAFGILGIGLNTAHDQARDNAVNALKAGKAVIESWNKALKDADKNYQNAEGKSTTGDGDGGGGGGLGGGGLGGGGLGPGGLNLPKGDGITAPGLPDPDMPGTDGPTLPGSDLPDPGGTDPSLPDPNLPNPGGTDPRLPDPNALDPNGTGRLPDGSIPGLGSDGAVNPLARTGLGLDDPTRTALSSYGQDGGAGQPRLPGTTTWTGDTGNLSGPSSRGGFSGGAAGVDAASLGAGRGAGTGGTGGASMMPLMPPGGAPGGEQDREREKTTWMSEDEGVWGGDEDIAPPVIGQDS